MKASAPTECNYISLSRAKWPRRGEIKMPLFPQRKNIRLANYDYSTDGAYFITICTENKEKSLSNISFHDDEVKNNLTEIGKTVERYIKSIPGVDVYVIMPNHVHMIIIKSNGKPISSDIRSFKGLTVKNALGLRWQRNYYEHVIRDDDDYRVKREYIETNPRRWVDDEYF
jgi:REP element-mobilizing transposase RayT